MSVMIQPRPTLLSLLVIGALLCVTLAGLGSVLNSVQAANATVHEIRGTVEAVQAGDDPPVIVVKRLSGSKEEVVVGAVLAPGAVVLRGKKRIGFDRVHVGDHVTLKYVKTRDGLTVRSITLHHN